MTPLYCAVPERHPASPPFALSSNHVRTDQHLGGVPHLRDRMMYSPSCSTNSRRVPSGDTASPTVTHGFMTMRACPSRSCWLRSAGTPVPLAVRVEWSLLSLSHTKARPLGGGARCHPGATTAVIRFECALMSRYTPQSKSRKLVVPRDIGLRGLY